MLAGEFVFLRTVDSVEGVGIDQSVLERSFEGAVEDGVIVKDGVGNNTRFKHPLIKILDVR